MSAPLLLTRPLFLEAPRSTARASAVIVVALFALRWISGIVEHLGPAGLSEYAALLMLAGLSLLFVLHLQLARRATLLLAGILTLLFAAQLSFAANPMPAPAEAYALIALLCLYALGAQAFFLHLNTPFALGVLRWLFAGFLCVGGLLSIVQIQSGFGFVDPARAQLIRAIGSDVHPVSFAIQLVLAGVGLIVVNLRTGRRLGALGILALGLGGLALYLTFARTAWVMAAMIVFYVTWVRGGLVVRVLSVSALALALVGFGQSARFQDLGSLPFFLSNFDWTNIVFDHRYIDNSVSWRIVNWGYGLTQALENPWLGIGPGQSALASSFGREMHSIVLEIFLEMGTIGLAGLVLTFAGLLRLHRSLPRGPDAANHARHYVNAAGWALLAAALLSSSLVDQLMSILIYFLLLAAAQTPLPAPTIQTA